MMKSYKTTIFACFTGYVVQAIINNFVPLLFITFQNTYHIPLARITLLVTINFCVQLCVDFLATFYADKRGYRRAIVAAQFLAALGLVLLTILPELMDPFTGILLSIVVYAVGGGLIEVLISPIMESCPTDNKEKAMSLLHSFYCWGHVGVVLCSTLFFGIFGIRNWRVLACIWGIIPLINGLIFMRAPIAPLIAEGEKGMTVGQLCKNRLFWLFVIMMVCSGASEQAVSQWASAFAEVGLGISKTAGDLAGPLTFAVLMGTARTLYGKYGEKISLDKFMIGSTLLCVASYLLTAVSANPVFSLIGCAACGFSVGIMWPGTFSKAAASLPTGGTAMFALLALAGDLGCSSGPTVVGFISDKMQGNLQTGILVAIVFPIMLLICLLLLTKKKLR